MRLDRLLILAALVSASTCTFARVEVVDSTGLQWRTPAKEEDSTYPLEKAIGACALYGANWRLPTPEEALAFTVDPAKEAFVAAVQDKHYSSNTPGSNITWVHPAPAPSFIAFGRKASGRQFEVMRAGAGEGNHWFCVNAENVKKGKGQPGSAPAASVAGKSKTAAGNDAVLTRVPAEQKVATARKNEAKLTDEKKTSSTVTKAPAEQKVYTFKSSQTIRAPNYLGEEQARRWVKEEREKLTSAPGINISSTVSEETPISCKEAKASTKNAKVQCEMTVTWNVQSHFNPAKQKSGPAKTVTR